MDEAEKENQRREDLVCRLNEFDSDVILVVYNEHMNGELDDQINYTIGEWTNDEFEEFLDVLAQRDKNIDVTKNL